MSVRRVLVALLLLLLPVGLVAAQTCRKTFANAQNAGNCYTISTTVVEVLVANTSRCSALIQNTSVNAMSCRDVTNDGPPSATAGTPVGAGGSLVLGMESQGRWQCIRTAAADATACVTEGRP